MKTLQRGIALVESLVATTILAIGLIGTLGLQARAISALSEATLRSEATLAAEQLMGLMSNDQGNLAAYAVAVDGQPGAQLAVWHAATRSNIPGSTIAIVVTPAAGTTRSQVDVTINWTRVVGAQANRHVVTFYVSQS